METARVPSRDDSVSSARSHRNGRRRRLEGQRRNYTILFCFIYASLLFLILSSLTYRHVYIYICYRVVLNTLSGL